ncbi:MAG: RNA 2',3'-cyclic phosphodiesterase [Thermoleophilaceae bacterium]
MARNSRSDPAPPATARLFVALEPCDEDRTALAEWRDRLIAGRDDLRPSATATLHLTLAFLGRRPEGEIAAIARAALDALEGMPPALLRPGDVVPVPRRGAPRLFALDLEDEDGRGAAIQAAAGAALARDGFWQPERRPWWPHVTLARVRPRRRAAPLEATMPAPGPLRAPLVTLYRSTLRPQGAQYDALERIELGYG